MDKAIASRDLGRLNDAWQQVVSDTDEITLGFDGSVSDDSTALVGCRIRDGMLFLIKLEQKPDGPQGAKWRVDRDSFDGRVRWVFNHYNVVGMFADTDEWGAVHRAMGIGLRRQASGVSEVERLAYPLPDERLQA